MMQPDYAMISASSFSLSALSSSCLNSESRRCSKTESQMLIRYDAVQVARQRAALAAGSPAAVRLAHGDGERMKLVEELRLLRCGIGGEGAAREIGEGIVGDPGPARWRASRACGVQRCGADTHPPQELHDQARRAVLRQQSPGPRRADREAAAQLRRGRRSESLERSAELLVEHRDKCLQRRCLARDRSPKAG